MNKRWSAAAVAVALVGTCMAGAALAAGDQNDPLVTKSYLEQTVAPSIVSTAQQQAKEQQEQLKAQLDKSISDYTQQMENLLGQGGSGGGASYQVVTLASGQKLQLEVGAEVMLRIGTAQCGADSAPGLIDVTSGGTLNNGSSLTVNHLYMATIEGRWISAGSGTVKVLVRGGYTLA